MTPLDTFYQDIIPSDYVENMTKYGEVMMLLLVIFLSSNMLLIVILTTEFIFNICLEFYVNVLKPYYITKFSQTEDSIRTDNNDK